MDCADRRAERRRTTPAARPACEPASNTYGLELCRPHPSACETDFTVRRHVTSVERNASPSIVRMQHLSRYIRYGTKPTAGTGHIKRTWSTPIAPDQASTRRYRGKSQQTRTFGRCASLEGVPPSRLGASRQLVPRLSTGVGCRAGGPRC